MCRPTSVQSAGKVAFAALQPSDKSNLHPQRHGKTTKLLHNKEYACDVSVDSFSFAI